MIPLIHLSLTDLTLMAFTVMLVVSLNIVAGLARHVVFCQAAFYGVGAYTVAIVGIDYNMPFWPTLLIGVGVSAACGLIVGLPVLRVSGLYFAMLTWGIGIVAQGLASNLSITGGDEGVGPTPLASVFGFKLVSSESFATVAWLAVVFTEVVVLLLSRSHAGWAMRSMGEDTRAAQVLGARNWYVLLAFTISAGCAGLAGGLFAYFIVQVNPSSFGVSMSIIVVVALLVGGLGSMIGSVVGAVAVSLVDIWLLSYPYVAQLILGVFLVAVVYLQPNGLLSAKRERLLVRRLTPSRLPVISQRASAAKARGESAALNAVTALPASNDNLQVAEVSKWFGGLRALSEVSFQLAPGECIGVIGPNGAGKSTLLDVISGFTVPTSGSVRIGKQDLLKVRPARRIGLGLFRTFQTPRLFPSETVYDNVLMGTFSWNRRPLIDRVVNGGTAQRAKADVGKVLALLGLEASHLSFAMDLSYGQQKIVEIGRGLAAKPRFLLLDEPLSGLDPDEAEHMMSVIQRVTASGVGVLLVEHNLGAVARTCKRVMVLHHGEEVANGSVDEVFRSADVRRAYFGPQPVAEG
jgi:branched-chain amino acid transport system permease protein